MSQLTETQTSSQTQAQSNLSKATPSHPISTQTTSSQYSGQPYDPQWDTYYSQGAPYVLIILCWFT